MQAHDGGEKITKYPNTPKHQRALIYTYIVCVYFKNVKRVVSSKHMA